MFLTRPILIRVDDKLHERLEDWRSQRRPLPAKAEAVRVLIETALNAEQPKKKSA
jgi:hypothetical protein